MRDYLGKLAVPKSRGINDPSLTLLGDEPGPGYPEICYYVF